MIPDLAPHEDDHDVNPARAGMILAWIAHNISDDGKPRASGDDPACVSALLLICK